VQLKGSVSSQYLTALLMAAPLCTGSEGIEILITDELVGRLCAAEVHVLHVQVCVHVSCCSSWVLWLENA